MPEEPRPEEPRREEPRPGDNCPVHPSVRRETTDASFRAVLFIILGAMVFAAVVHYALLEFFYNRRGLEDAAKESPYPLAPGPSEALPAEPRLEQVNRMADVEKGNVYLRQETREERLENYGPTAEDGYVHVPIGRAMQYLAEEKPPPSRAAPPGDRPWRADGLIDGGESNSGREFRGKPR